MLAGWLGSVWLAGGSWCQRGLQGSSSLLAWAHDIQMGLVWTVWCIICGAACEPCRTLSRVQVRRIAVLTKCTDSLLLMTAAAAEGDEEGEGDEF